MFLNPQIVFRREFDGSGLLFHPDTGEVFALNPTAARPGNGTRLNF